MATIPNQTPEPEEKEVAQQMWARWAMLIVAALILAATIFFLGAIIITLINNNTNYNNSSLGECGSLTDTTFMLYESDPSQFMPAIEEVLINNGSIPGSLTSISGQSFGNCYVAIVVEDGAFRYIHLIYLRFREGNLANVVDILHIESIQITNTIIEATRQKFFLLPSGE